TKLIESTEACQGVVGAAYSMRRPGHMIGGIDTTKLAPNEKVVFFNGGSARPATYLGMGMTAIHRSVFERLVARADAKFAAQRSLLDQVHAEANGRQLTADNSGSGSGSVPSAVSRPPSAGEHPVQSELLSQLEQALAQHALPRLKSGISDPPVVPFFSMLQLKDIYYGEDVSFCLRCHDAEIPIQIDTRVRVYHKGSYCYGL